MTNIIKPPPPPVTLPHAKKRRIQANHCSVSSARAEILEFRLPSGLTSSATEHSGKLQTTAAQKELSQVLLQVVTLPRQACPTELPATKAGKEKKKKKRFQRPSHQTPHHELSTLTIPTAPRPSGSTIQGPVGTAYGPVCAAEFQAADSVRNGAGRMIAGCDISMKKISSRYSPAITLSSPEVGRFLASHAEQLLRESDLIFVNNEVPLLRTISVNPGIRLAEFQTAVRNCDRRCVITGNPAYRADYGTWRSFEATHIFPLAYEGHWRTFNYSR